MKKFLAIIISILVLSSLLAGCGKSKASSTPVNEIKQKGKFIVGLDDSFPPMGFRDEKGEIVGFDIDLAKEAAKRMGLEVEFKPVVWDGVLLSLKNKDIDVIWNGLTITEERKKQIDFTKPYLEDRQIVVVKGNSNIASKKDLAGKVIGLQLGSTSEQALNSDAETAKSIKELRKYSNNTEALMDLKAGRIDAVVVDEISGRYYVAKNPGDYKILNEDFGKQIVGVGVRKEDTAFKEELDKVLDEMKKDGTAAEISKKWFGADILTK
ncbi:amino acid ABC transporter substrate-binding protein [Fonticella tunisiensis]|uniref:Amino acid ABC transporter substrate-binding protein (PAAT family) n=1 Tax=Fonticella tunisiensis TaxID=1096341 RepID=A0A4R7KT76_9CLOT|nr:amino acid ABC transporter substrate-binding protein [Fonticella tunisiensis]TDT63288.1 amino acid ABC transporter substrate-binding protein (PAAT family) [Fonticella tunisiensis]